MFVVIAVVYIGLSWEKKLFSIADHFICGEGGLQAGNIWNWL